MLKRFAAVIEGSETFQDANAGSTIADGSVVLTRSAISNNWATAPAELSG